jgi:hypothetical protein
MTREVPGRRFLLVLGPVSPALIGTAPTRTHWDWHRSFGESGGHLRVDRRLKPPGSVLEAPRHRRRNPCCCPERSLSGIRQSSILGQGWAAGPPARLMLDRFGQNVRRRCHGSSSRARARHGPHKSRRSPVDQSSEPGTPAGARRRRPRSRQQGPERVLRTWRRVPKLWQYRMREATPIHAASPDRRLQPPEREERI